MIDEQPSVAAPLASVVGVVAAAALVPLNSTMIAVALPSIADDFDVSTARVSVLVTLYLVVMLVGQPIAGRVADAVGSRRTVRFALAGLAGFSVLAALAPSFPMLVAARALQAGCAAALGPGVQSLLRAMAPPGQQGRMFGILGSSLGAGAASGPVIGGVLVQIFDWRGIFVFNAPIAVLALVATTVGVAQVDQVERPPVATPARPSRILNPVFAAGYSSQALTTQAQYALLLLTPIVLDARGWSAGTIGLVLSALTVGMIVSGPLGGRIGDRHGRRLPSMVGIGFAGVATGALAVGGRAVDPIVLVIALAAVGVGLGAAMPNLMSAALGSVPESRTGSAAGVFTTSRYVGSLTTTALIAAWVTSDGAGMRSVLGVATICMLLGLVAAGALPGRLRTTSTPAAASSTTGV